MSGYQCLTLLIACSASAQAADLQEIVRRGIAAINSDWAADLNYAYVERNETLKNGKTTSKTSQVVMMEGSDYSMPTAINDQPLPPEGQKAELKKLKDELARRRNEDAGARQRRIAKYQKARDENGALLLDFPQAFSFELLREETMNGYPAYVLSATPKNRRGPLSRAAKVLSGMRGTVWIDQESFHVIQAECTVFMPVAIFGVLAKVLPGTQVKVEMTPVAGSVWLISRLDINLAVAKLWFKSTEVTRLTYTEYRMNADVLDELLAKATGL